MITFFGSPSEKIVAVQTLKAIHPDDFDKLFWLFGEKPRIQDNVIAKPFIGPRAAMITPWSTNAVEITQNMGIYGIIRIEEFVSFSEKQPFDPMVSQKYPRLHQEIFTIDRKPEAILEIKDIAAYNQQEGLSLSDEEVEYLDKLSGQIGRKLKDSEVFGFSQVNSEHCRHKIFNGTFIIDGVEKPISLFKLIKKTSEAHPNNIVSAYKDNVAFIKGPRAMQFAPERPDQPSYYKKESFKSVLSLKAETHNFPTTVEPFSGAATGSGGEIRDRLAGGKGSIPLAGTAVYMTAYSRLADNRPWEGRIAPRKWLYQSPSDILLKASNGASDFGNKFGQPLIVGSVYTFENESDDAITAYDKVIMQAGGVGYGKAEQALKDHPTSGDKIVVLGGDNYRIGMGGAAVSSADTGEFGDGIELNAVQRSNPEMQKRVANAIRGLVESTENPIVSIHDHGAGGHLNCLSELVEETGGLIDLDKLPIGDPTLSAKEIIGNESQERMGLIISEKHIELLQRVAERERAPFHEVGEVTTDKRFTIKSSSTGQAPMDLGMDEMFGSSPKTVMIDKTVTVNLPPLSYDPSKLLTYIKEVLNLESVACKDWLTNKVDRCVGGRVAKQQCGGPLQLPLNNCGVMAIDFEGTDGIATSIGHASGVALIDPAAGSRMAITEALTNIVWAPLSEGLSSVSLSANWMWPCKNAGEDARLYVAVEAVSDFSIALGINVPTGKDSLSMKQKYADREVKSPGTVIISAAGHCNQIENVVEPVMKVDGGDIYYINLSTGGYALGGSAMAQVVSQLGDECPDVIDPSKLRAAFNGIQKYMAKGALKAGHDISSGGMSTTLLEMCFSTPQMGMSVDLTQLEASDDVKLLLSESAGLIVQLSDDKLIEELKNHGISAFKIGTPTTDDTLHIKTARGQYKLSVSELRDVWYETSYLMDKMQSGEKLAKARYDNYKMQPLNYKFPNWHTGRVPKIDNTKTRPIAGIIREKGSNSEREMANALYLAGWQVRDIHMTDLINGRETLEDVQFLGAVGGFSNSDVLGSAKGWAGAFLYNEKAKKALDTFFKRKDVLSVGICNGCQLFMELDLVTPGSGSKMTYNDSHKHESAFTSVTIQENNSVMLSNFAGSTLGVWISHGEGKFVLPQVETKYHIVGKYGYEQYPSNPNGSVYNVAMLCSQDGRHLVTMPHIERSTFRWNWAHYPADREDKVSPWVQAFVNAREWVENIEK